MCLMSECGFATSGLFIYHEYVQISNCIPFHLQKMREAKLWKVKVLENLNDNMMNYSA